MDWVLAQLNNNAVHPAGIMLKKIRVVDFIDNDLPSYRIRSGFAIPR
jgi:hypothetical protein